MHINFGRFADITARPSLDSSPPPKGRLHAPSTARAGSRWVADGVKGGRDGRL